jgi:LysR family transcriptional regulator, transcriptional activator of nhaA
VDWLNYHHLLYFWTVAREGSIAAACGRLHLAQPTISAQLRALEKRLGGKLFEKSGRGLALTEMGRTTLRYADEIFALGRELSDALAGRHAASSVRIHVGVADVVPKLIAHRLILPALHLPEPARLLCVEAGAAELLSRLAVGEIDVVISDAPIDPHVKVKAFNHLLGECGTSVMAARRLARRHRPGFPRSLDAAPFLFPTSQSTLRRALERYFDAEGIRPRVVAEFDDSALLKTFGQSGEGLFAVPTAIERDVSRMHDVQLVGRLQAVRESYYAISIERKLKHPAVLAIASSARDRIFR